MGNAAPSVYPKTARLEKRSGRDAEPPLFPAGYVASGVFRDFDAMAHAAKNWEQEYYQWGRGPFRGRLQQAHTSRLQLGTVGWSPGVIIEGETPRGAVVFGIPRSCQERCYWHGAQTQENEIRAAAPGEEVDLHAHGNCEMAVVSIDALSFEEHARALWGRHGAIQQSCGRWIATSPAARQRILQSWGDATDQAIQLGAHLCDRRLASHLEAEVLDALLTNAGAPGLPATLAERRRAAIGARRYMLDALEEPTTIKDICQAVGTTERTLHQGFREAFGVTPKNFLKVLRLNAVHRALQHAAATDTVTQCAFRWGFFHLARFAADYRQMFGELPSETLRKQHA